MRKAPVSLPLSNLCLAFPDELIIDNFAGGGGTSEGLERAFGRPVDVAINHDPEALAMHALNHPYTRHICESVWNVDPIEITSNRPVALVWLSPDCRHFSKAKGATPVAKEIRGLAWVTLRWVLQCRPRAFMLENVEEFQTWGPLVEVRPGCFMPDPARRGETFSAFIGMLSTGIEPDHPALLEACEFLGVDPAGPEAKRMVEGLGYDLQSREVRACDHGAPTIRKRFFVIGRCDGQPIVWPSATHGPVHVDSRTDSALSNLKPYRTAADCIDFDRPARSVFGRPRPLVANTMRRVAKGLWRHVLNNPAPYIVGSNGAAADEDQPVVQSPFVGECANGSRDRTMAVDEPLRTQCAQTKRGHFSVVSPTLMPATPTVTASALAPFRGTAPSQMNGRSVTAPAPTVSSQGTHHGLMGARLVTAAPHITVFRTGTSGSAMDAPLPTVTANSFVKRPGGSAPLGVVAAHLVDAGHGEGSGGKRWSHGIRPADTPLNSVTASGSPSYVASAHLTHLTHHGERCGYSLNEPTRSVTAAHRGEQAIVTAFMEQAYGGFYDGDGRAVSTPISTVTSTGAQQRLVTAYLVKYYSEGGQWQDARAPLHTLPTKARMGLVQAVQIPVHDLDAEHLPSAKACADLLHEHLPEHFPQEADVILVWHADQWWVLADITLRMLAPRELYRAQSFPESYIIDEIPDPRVLFVNGQQVEGDPRDLPRIPLTGTAQVRMCGNSVCPIVAQALVAANFSHERQFGQRLVA